MQVWNVQAARWKYRMQKWCKYRHLRTIAQLCRAVSSQLRHESTIGKNLLNTNMSSTSPPQQYGELRSTNGRDRFGSLGTPANFNGFRVLPSLLQRRHSPETGAPVKLCTTFGCLLGCYVIYMYIYTLLDKCVNCCCWRLLDVTRVHCQWPARLALSHSHQRTCCSCWWWRWRWW